MSVTFQKKKLINYWNCIFAYSALSHSGFVYCFYCYLSLLGPSQLFIQERSWAVFHGWTPNPDVHGPCLPFSFCVYFGFRPSLKCHSALFGLNSKGTYLTQKTFKQYHYCPNPAKAHKVACQNFSMIPDRPEDHRIFLHSFSSMTCEVKKIK